jgi:hypothetical protein
VKWSVRQQQMHTMTTIDTSSRLPLHKLMEHTPIDWRTLVTNTAPAAIRKLEENFDKEILPYSGLVGNMIRCNESAFHIIGNRLDVLTTHNLWGTVCTRPYAIKLICEQVKRDKIIEAKYKESWVTGDIVTETQKIEWQWLSANTNAWEIIRDNTTRCLIDYTPLAHVNASLSANQSDWAIHYLTNHTHLISPDVISANECDHALNLLTHNPQFISWGGLSGNSNPMAFELLRNNQDKINWQKLATNTNKQVQPWLEKHLDQMAPYDEFTQHCPSHYSQVFANLCGNRTEWAMQIITRHLNNIDAGGWINLSENEYAVELLEQNPTHINKSHVWANPKVFPPE